MPGGIRWRYSTPVDAGPLAAVQALQFEQVFTSAIEVGIAIAGFSGIAAVMGQRARGTWSGVELARIAILLQTSFMAIAFSFLPLVLDGARVAEPVIWRIGSGCFVLYTLVTVPHRFRGALRVRDADGSVSMAVVKVIFPFLLVFAAFQAYNAAFLHEGWAFVLVVMIELAMGFFMFVRLLRMLWDEAPAQQGVEPDVE
ncbi:MAG: hypothetical protein DWP92_03885 [Armatimonadetes bacterium]|nr:MAG: hypothetical protein DWP92_03885 [Armatimonadota bacterium]